MSSGVFGAAFQDLNFDSANTNNIFDGSGFGDYYGLNADLIPGWQLFEGTVPVGPIGFNLTLPGSGYTTILSPDFGAHAPVVGLYSFAMLPRFDVQGRFDAISLAQSGDVPPDARSIHFLSYGAPLQLEISGLLVPLLYTPISPQPGWNRSIPVFDAAGDVASYAGQNVELKFTTLLIPNYQGLNGLDEIAFSPMPIPEPGTFVLFSLGCAIWGVRLRRRSK